jgi:AcrR family transcriptional regulator
MLSTVNRTPKTSLRKPPRTLAGGAIKDAVLDAAEALIAEDGIVRLTTNRVATRAGVSIGSLYQYFPNKESILAELVRRMERSTLELIDQALMLTESESLERTAAAIVDVLLGDNLGRVPTRAALRRAVPVEWCEPTSAEVDAQVRVALAKRFADRADIRQGPLAMIWVIAHAVELVVESAVLHAPAMLHADDFRQELIELVVRYLRVEPTVKPAPTKHRAPGEKRAAAAPRP